MREHKYRAWDTINKKWFSDNFFIDNHGIVFIEDEDIASVIALCPVIGLEIEYFTGKQDKNGKDIYEGDKLRDGAGESIVIWNDQYASFALRSDSWAFDHFFGEAVESKDTEIISNIHEEQK